MKKITLVLAGLIFCVSSLVYADVQERITPLPHYTKEKGYGWDAGAPANKSDNVWWIIKVWRGIGSTFTVFVDKDKDGKCDMTFEFIGNGKFTPSGEPYVIRVRDSNCEQREKAIKNYIKMKEGEVDL